MTKISTFVNSVVARLADLVEFTDAAVSADDSVRRAHYAKLADQEEKMEVRLARALGVEARAVMEMQLPWEDADREVARRQRERKRMMDLRRRERAEAIDEIEGLHA